MLDRLVKCALRAMWLVVIPALAASVCLRYALLEPVDLFAAKPRGGPELFLAEHWPWAWALAFVALSLVVRYWAPVLPGGHALLFRGEALRSLGSSARVSGLIVGIAVAAALVIRGNVAGVYRVKGASMLPSLEAGDRLFVNKLAYGTRAPRRGDAILLRREIEGEARELIKRVIGLPGDRVRMAGPHPVINGWSVPSCELGPYTYVQEGLQLVGHASIEFLGHSEYLVANTLGQGAPAAEFVVGEGEVFVLGDNRSGSQDSRSFGGERGGGVPFTAIVGHVTKTLVGVTRRGEPDFRQLFLPPADFNLRGFDVRPLESALEGCRAKRPKDTSPPAPSPKVHGQASVSLTLSGKTN